MRRTLLALGTLWLAMSGQAQGGHFDVKAIDGRLLTGGVALEDGRLHVRPQDGDHSVVGVADVEHIVRAGAEAAVPRDGPFLWLRSGSSMPLRALAGSTAGDGRSLVVETPSGARLELPLRTIAALRTRKHEPKSFAADQQAPDINSDYLYVVSDGAPRRFSVTIDSVREQTVHFQLRGASYSYSLVGDDSIAGVVFGKNTGFAPDRQAKPRVLATLVSGEMVEGRLKAFGDRLTIGMDEGVDFDVPIAALARLDVLSDKLTWLGALEPKVEQTAAFDRAWPWTKDASPVGPGLQLGGKSYTRGIVLVPRTKLTYELGGRYDSFEAMVGIDDRAGPQAHALMRVIADGKVLFESPPMVRGSQPVAVRVQLDKCRTLAIEADFGKNFDLGDLCTFADARLLQH